MAVVIDQLLSHTKSKIPFHLAQPLSTKKITIDVEFADYHSSDELTQTIASVQNPQVIIWYIGSYGLREEGVQFYKDFLISPTLKQNPNTTFWLTDLSAWRAFKDPEYSIERTSRHCDTIESFYDHRIRCIKSSDILKKMKQISSQKIINHLRKSFKKDFITQASQDFSDKNITLGEIFSYNCPILADWYEYDSSKIYSICQYLEGCLLINEIIEKSLNAINNRITIMFTLPNDEIKFYKDSLKSFELDAGFLTNSLTRRFNINNIRVSIKFIPFRYGHQIKDRPYNPPGKRFNKKTLSLNDIIGAGTLK